MQYLQNQFQQLLTNTIIKPINMKKKLIKLFLVSFSLLLLSSCEKVWYLSANYYVENKTNSEYLIYQDYANDTRQKDKICSILPNVSKQIIDSSILEFFTQDLGADYFNTWIYNIKDSTYVKLSLTEIKENSKYGRVEVSDTKQINPLTIIDYYITISDTLMSKMTKNTTLTDSIFGLKK